jgi:hypothetical protein
MITNETEIRIALQAILVSVLALYGFWGCAFVVLVILLPWRPFLAVGGYLAQPVVDWRLRKAREHHEKGIAQIEKELDNFLNSPRGGVRAPAPAPAPKVGVASKPSLPEAPQPLAAFKAVKPNEPAFQELTLSGHNLSATLEIPAAITHHVRNLPQGAFSNMDLEVEQVKFSEDSAEAYVRFQSSHVKELAIRQRYILRKSNGYWQVESRQPANGGSKVPQHSPSTLGQAKEARAARA